MVKVTCSDNFLDLGSRLNSPLLTGQDYVSPSLRTSSQFALSLEVNLLEPTHYVTTPFSPAVPFSLNTGYRGESVPQSMLHPLAMQSFQESMLNLTTDAPVKPSILSELSQPVFAASAGKTDAARDISLPTARDISLSTARSNDSLNVPPSPSPTTPPPYSLSPPLT